MNAVEDLGWGPNGEQAIDESLDTDLKTGTLISGANVRTGGYPLRVSGDTGGSGDCLATLKNLERLQSSSLDSVNAQRLASTLSGATCIDGGTANTFGIISATGGHLYGNVLEGE